MSAEGAAYLWKLNITDCYMKNANAYEQVNMETGVHYCNFTVMPNHQNQ